MQSSERIAEVLGHDRSYEESRGDEPVHCAIGTLVVRHGDFVGQVVVGDVVEDDTRGHGAAAGTHDSIRLDLVGVAGSQVESEGDVARPVTQLTRFSRRNRHELRTRELLLIVAQHSNRAGVDHDPAGYLCLILETYLDNPCGSERPDIFPIKRQLLEFFTIELQRVVVEGDELAFQPFVGRQLNPVELVRRRGSGLKRLWWTLRHCARCRKCLYHSDRECASDTRLQ